MKKIELIYDKDCPNVEEARKRITVAQVQADLPQIWKEWDRNDPASPGYASSFGSPTILVDGKDVAGVPEAEGNNCRIYKDHLGGIFGVPPVEQIVFAMKNPVQSKWKIPIGAFPAFGAAFLPRLTCPTCWPAYSWLLGVLGFEFVNYTPWLFPITAVFLTLSLSVLVFGAKQRRGYGPFLRDLPEPVYFCSASFSSMIHLLPTVECWS